ncbi:MAG: molybdenum cofactor guanylyltransferase [Sphingobium sp.]
MSDASSSKLLGAVLAGGRSTRFGSDKAAALLGGSTLLDHAVAGLAPHVHMVAICGRIVPGKLSLADRPRPDMGPLGGIAGALRHAAHHGFDGVLTTGCDMPVFPTALARALIGDRPATLIDQPLAGFWPARLADALDAWLAGDGDRSIRGWGRHVGAMAVEMPGPALPNVNRVEDLAELARLRNDGTA